MRFHIGFSFRLKYLKKFLFPILIGILAYFGLGGLFGCLQANAQVNYDSQYNLNYNNFYEDPSYVHSNDSLTFVLYSILNYYRDNNSYYDLFIGKCYNLSSMCIYLINKNANLTTNNNSYGYNSKISGVSQWRVYFDSTITFNTSNNTPQNASYIYSLPLSSSYNVFSTNWYNSLTSCLSNAPSSSYCTGGTAAQGFSSNYTYSSNIYLFDVPYITVGASQYINNNDSFSFNNVVPYYYSSFDINFRTNSTITNNESYYVKDINFITSNNNFLYHVGNKIYSYFDIINGNSNSNANFEEYNRLGKFYIGSIPKNNISNLNIDLNYNYNSYEYTNTLNYNFVYFGRKNNSTYYSYEQINCTGVNGLVSSSFDLDNKKTTTTIFPNGLSCSTDLSNYDNIYIYLEIIPNSSFDDTIYNLQYNSNYGYIKNLNPNLTTSNQIFIYERFENLDSNFEILLSTQDESNSAYFESDNKYIVFNKVDRNNNKIDSFSYNPIKFGIAYNSNAMLFNIPRYYGGLSNVDLFIHYDSILSIGNNNNFTYYDSSNNLTTDTIVNNKLNSVDDNNYNMNYYFGVVNGFIDDLILSIISFSNITQNFYDSMPQFFQVYLLVNFILVCFYFTYLLVRK